MLYETIKSFPDQLLKGWEISQKANLSSITPKQYRHIYYSGMGGSSFPADLVNDYLQSNLSLIVVRDYALPATAQQNDLVLCASFSGNTEETLSVFKEALEKKMNVVALSNGGKLKDLAQTTKTPLIQIPSCIQPRCAAGYFFSTILGILYKLELIASQYADLDELTRFLHDNQKKFEKIGHNLAEKLVKRIPVIYGPKHLEGTCRVWKIKFNENTKIPSFYNVFPELTHNEMVAYSHMNSNLDIIYLLSPNAHKQIQKRMEVMKSLLSSKIPFHQIHLTGKGQLQEMFESLAISDYTSYFLAKMYGVDPEAVTMIEDFKLKLKSNSQ